VQPMYIEPKDVSIKFNTTDELINIVPVTQLQFKDGARVRSIDGATLTRTSLVLQMQGYLSHLKGLVELDENGELKVVVLETLIVRREQEGNSKMNNSLQTSLLVENGQIIEPKTAVAKTEVLAINDGTASIKGDLAESRRLLVNCSNFETVVDIKGKATVKKGDFIKLDSELSASGDISPVSGKIVDVSSKSITIRNGRPYLISPGTMLQVNEGSLVLRGDMLASLVFEREKTGDIVQGLPRVEELLEARKPKDCAILAEYDGVAEIEIEDDMPRLFLVSDEGSRTEIKFSIDASIVVTNKQKIKKGQPLTSGPLNPHDVIRLCGPEEAQQYLVDEVQRVYRSQGVEIADKHIEIIVRQMTKKVRIVDSGDTNLLPGELVELQVFENENNAVAEHGGQEATCEYMLLGITKASLNTESFISAASFQETTRILTEAAVEGKKDLLRGLKENVIIGRLIPAGTGFHHLSFANEERDKEAQKRAAQRNQARKPSAILEEIEGMFGSPDLVVESEHIIED
ncbi:DNA-directed RNA polymerase subunit beta', partial [bacterium]|nr:DNA-directed RNA polymerase subunit beta' [bacterium]